MAKSSPLTQKAIREWLGATGEDLARLLLLTRSSLYNAGGKHLPRNSTVKDMEEVRQWIKKANEKVGEPDIPLPGFEGMNKQRISTELWKRGRRRAQLQKELDHIETQYRRNQVIILRLEALTVTAEDSDVLRFREKWRKTMILRARARLASLRTSQRRLPLILRIAALDAEMRIFGEMG